MRIEKGGTCRNVIVGKKLVAKVAKPTWHDKQKVKDQLLSWIKGLRIPKERRGRWEQLKAYFLGGEQDVSLFGHLCRGILENLRERALSSQLADTAVPTRLSLLGIMNIQDVAQDVDFDTERFTDILSEKLPSSTLVNFGIGHTVKRPENFGVHNRELKLRDYGGRGLRRFLKEYRAEFAEALAEITYTVK
jgi:hypothetical protein